MTYAQCLPTFGMRDRFNTGGNHPVAVVPADFNHDGHVDLAVANNQSATVGILLGTGEGGPTGFSAATTYPMSSASIVMMVGADFNLDGHVDLAAINEGNAADARLTVRLGLGDAAGGFGPETVFDGIGGSPSSLAVGDFNADTYPDVVISNATSPGGVTLLLNDGAGQFNAGFSFQVALRAEDIGVGHFNDDDLPDVVVLRPANCCESGLTVMLGSPTLLLSAPSPVIFTGGDVHAMSVADVNADGLDDVVVTLSNAALQVRLANPDGTLSPAESYENPEGVNPASSTFCDLDGDDAPDLAVANYDGHNVSLWRNDGTGVFSRTPNVPLGANNPLFITAADLNHDGRQDLITCNARTCCGGSNDVSVLGATSLLPRIAQQPADQAILAGSSASFTVSAAGSGAITYQWYRDGVLIPDATLPTLTLNAVTLEDDGAMFHSVATSSCGSSTSEAATLIVHTCTADFDGDGAVNSQDFFNFLTAFFAGCP